MIKFVLLTVAFFAAATAAFAPGASRMHSSTALNAFGGAKKGGLATPTFNKDTQLWEKAASDDGKYPYDAIGALLRHGPSPWFSRVTNPAQYEQAVLKYMAVAKVDRSEATGNMDAQLNNAADWAYAKMEEKKGRPKTDYTFLDKKQAALTIVWALIIMPTVFSVVSETVTAFTSH